MKKSFFGRYSSALTINNGKSKNIRDAKWYDKSVPCRSACPADTDIPGYLEAIYNDCILILHKDWIQKGTLFVENINCLAVKDEHELKDILLDNIKYDREKIIKNAKKILEDH